MDQLPDYLKPSFAPQAKEEAIIAGKNYRFTILTAQMIRLEYAETGEFEDRPSQVFWYRQQPVPEFDVKKDGEHLVIETDKLILEYQLDDNSFNEDNLTLTVKDLDTKWHPGKENSENLKGTIRTLDAVEGRTKLNNGLLSRDGWAVVDDSTSLIFDQKTGWLKERKDQEAEDLYFFGYGHNYLKCLKDFNAVTGEVPLLPRWALGNWWSRYWRYTQEELKSLMKEFQEREIPLSVCIIDMDWHLIENQYTDGWTGYTWNKDLFPNPAGFINWLHQQQLKTTLNLHPAAGVHPHEEQYREFAQRVGIDPETEEPIDFDMTDLDFIKNYFELLHHPKEEIGIDFWWIDWQQGQKSKMPHLDPLWALNHLHFYDRKRNNKRPFIFSRWSGLGSHRYPIGFSGDTIISWDSLRFQPYFTATASNVSYGWWSHDIGGHCKGQDEAELYARWVQFGVLSPIMRLHSTKEKYLDRRPWTKGHAFYTVVKEAMRFRHALIPYLYTMAWKNHQEAEPLVQPMYYQHPKTEEAYNFPNQYYFGSQLLAAPHLNPRGESTNLSRKVVWLPEGDWMNFFTGEYYAGDNCYVEYGSLDELPIFAQAGSIVPLDHGKELNGVENPAELDLYIFAGADNEFELYEDAGTGLEYQNGAAAITKFIQNWSTDQLHFEISSVAGDKSVVPINRDYKLFFRGIKRPDGVNVTVDGQLKEIAFNYDEKKETVIVYIPEIQPSNQVTVNLFTETGNLLSHRERTEENCYQLLKSFKMKTRAKTQIEEIITSDQAQDNIEELKDFLTVLTDEQLRAIVEVFYGLGVDKIKTDKRDKIIAWNNNKQTQFKYYFSAWSKEEPNSNSGIIPKFKVFPLVEWEDSKWQLEIDYCELFNILYTKD